MKKIPMEEPLKVGITKNGAPQTEEEAKAMQAAFEKQAVEARDKRVKEFKKLSLRQKKQYKILLKGKLIPIHVYIKILCKDMLPMVDEDKDKAPVDHAAYMTKFYMRDGLDGIDDYIKAIDEVEQKTINMLTELNEEKVKEQEEARAKEIQENEV